MGLASFLNALFDSGRVRVLGWGETLLPADVAAAAQVLAAHEQLVWREFPGGAPEYRPAPALWAAKLFQRACQAAVYRDVGAAEVERSLEAGCPEEATAGCHYSVDVVFRFLPDLARLAQSAAENDPLLGRLRQWGAAWPYSSVGMPLSRPGDRAKPEPDLDGIAGHAGLLRAYVDRVIERGDLSRLADSRVREAAAAALGAFPQLAPSVARALAPLPQVAAP